MNNQGQRADAEQNQEARLSGSFDDADHQARERAVGLAIMTYVNLGSGRGQRQVNEPPDAA